MIALAIVALVCEEENDKIEAFDAKADDAGAHLYNNISNLRHKIEADPSRPAHIIIEPGVGYRPMVE